MNKKYIVIGVLVLAVVAVACFVANKPAEETRSAMQSDDGSASTTFTASSVKRRELSLHDWQNYIGTDSGMKYEVTFLYPSEWNSSGVFGGGQSASNYFYDKELDHDVAYLHTNSFGYYEYDIDSEYSNVIKKETVIIDGWPGDIVYRSITKPGKNEKKEWWLLIPQVGEERVLPDKYEIYGDTYFCTDSHCPNKRSYDFYMEDIYSNSDEIFHQLVNSIKFPDSR